jgi:hypothetical protein
MVTELNHSLARFQVPHAESQGAVRTGSAA